MELLQEGECPHTVFHGQKHRRVDFMYLSWRLDGKYVW